MGAPHRKRPCHSVATHTTGIDGCSLRGEGETSGSHTPPLPRGGGYNRKARLFDWRGHAIGSTTRGPSNLRGPGGEGRRSPVFAGELRLACVRKTADFPPHPKAMPSYGGCWWAVLARPAIYRHTASSAEQPRAAVSHAPAPADPRPLTRITSIHCIVLTVHVRLPSRTQSPPCSWPPSPSTLASPPLPM